MKWGVRRYQNEDGTLTDKGIKRYAKKGYSQDSFRSNKTRAGKAFDLYTGAHKRDGSVKYDLATKKQRKERAEKYLADKNKSTKQKVTDYGKRRQEAEQNKSVYRKTRDLQKTYQKRSRAISVGTQMATKYFNDHGDDGTLAGIIGSSAQVALGREYARKINEL